MVKTNTDSFSRGAVDTSADPSTRTDCDSPSHPAPLAFNPPEPIMAPLIPRHVTMRCDLHPDDQEIITLVERGMTLKSVAAKTGGALHQITGLLESEAGRQLLESLRAQREYEILEQRDMMRSARDGGIRVLVAAQTAKDATWTNRIAAATKSIEFDPDHLFVKTERKEVSGRIEHGYDRNGFLSRTEDILVEACAGPTNPDELRRLYGEDAVLELEPDPDPIEVETVTAESAGTGGSSFHLSAMRPASGDRRVDRAPTRAEKKMINKQLWKQKQAAAREISHAQKVARMAAKEGAGDGG